MSEFPFELSRRGMWETIRLLHMRFARNVNCHKGGLNAWILSTWHYVKITSGTTNQPHCQHLAIIRKAEPSHFATSAVLVWLLHFQFRGCTSKSTKPPPPCPPATAQLVLHHHCPVNDTTYSITDKIVPKIHHLKDTRAERSWWQCGRTDSKRVLRAETQT